MGMLAYSTRIPRWAHGVVRASMYLLHSDFEHRRKFDQALSLPFSRYLLHDRPKRIRPFGEEHHRNHMLPFLLRFEDRQNSG